MASTNKAGAGKEHAARVQRERARVYEARERMHSEAVSRRRRDNIIAGIVGGVIVVGAIVGQAVYFGVGPGKPVPTVSPTSTTTVLPTPESTPTTAPESSPTPEPESSTAE
ncbi:hypothetical protein [Microbacterium gorillae]|uniref:hypothetical protein n=1 Tax=Microbacterium gorillae TaxID=1231063 RepID=UPI00058D9BA7|nr:hypothetical protein [Microbacterium gorillae]